MADMVGLVGVGAMGSALLTRLHKAGQQVQAFDLSEAARKRAQQAGATPVDSAAAAAKGARYIHVFVRSDAEVIEAVLGAKGVLAGAEPGSVVFLHSTILPTTTRQVAEAAAKRRVQVIDAPITAVPAKVQAGEATFLVGGPEELVKTVRPHLESLGKGMHHFGPLGAGNVAKLVKNLTNGTERVMIAQALMLAEAGGIDARQMLAVMQAEDHGSIVHSWEKAFTVENGHVGLKGGANIFNKDLPLAAELAKIYALDLGVIREAAQAGMRYTGVDKLDPLPPTPKR
jgi:3-hydroxyisobutyrate dehydrogenase-like beta-hydroxyacid dehydrogenase